MSDSTLFTSVTIITVDSSRRIILGGYLLVQGSRITHVGSQPPTSPLPTNTRTISLPGRIIIPGLINTHAHLAQSLLRGLAEDLPLHDWLCDRIWPLEAAYAGTGDDADGYVAARLTIAEMLKSGTTCFLEAMLTHGSGFDNVARAVAETGIRACLGKLVKFVETIPALRMADARDRDLHQMSIPSLLAAHETHDGSCDGRIQVWAACGTPRGAPIAGFKEVAEACQAHGIGITMHCAEAPRDLPIFRSSYDGMSPMQFCAAAGLARPRTVLAHMCHLDLEADLPILAESGTSVAHNPTSNLKLASGVTCVPEMVAAGINVGLGTDGAPCNNTYDMLREMHLAAVLHRGRSLDATTVGAHAALEMATVHGAKALGLEQDIGSLEVGKKADLVVLDVRGCWSAPWNPDVTAATAQEDGGCDPVTVVVGTCTGRDVELVMVDGVILVEDGALVRLDEVVLVAAARKSIQGIQARSGVKAKPKPGWHYE
ncbi:Amidohydrolase 1 [Niveomyces insectorum RCEF 264]|uniref:Amidohydrolase 1 n=1 Tax=Niveomyces insectorum RCEF 264 TaxID=1081102 RepID=A0A162KC18_9HYPO|nr:Amidohydrolase 1 [Niveomyces insectorum RCEF 264]